MCQSHICQPPDRGRSCTRVGIGGQLSAGMPSRRSRGGTLGAQPLHSHNRVASYASTAFRVAVTPCRYSLFAVRWLRKSPGFTLVAVASLAIGIGFNTALFAIVDALLFKPLPVAAPERLVDVFTSDSTGTVTFSTSSYPDYLDLQRAERRVRRHRRLQPDVRGAQPRQPLAPGDGRDRHRQLLPGASACRAALGRTILPADDRAGAPRVVMVSHRYWTRELGSAPDADRPHACASAATRTRSSASRRPASTGWCRCSSPEMWIPVSASLDVEPVGMHDAVPSPTGTTRLDRRADRWLFMRGAARRRARRSSRRAPTSRC